MSLFSGWGPEVLHKSQLWKQASPLLLSPPPARWDSSAGRSSEPKPNTGLQEENKAASRSLFRFVLQLKMQIIVGPFDICFYFFFSFPSFCTSWIPVSRDQNQNTTCPLHDGLLDGCVRPRCRWSKYISVKTPSHHFFPKSSLRQQFTLYISKTGLSPIQPSSSLLGELGPHGRRRLIDAGAAWGS